MALGKESYCCFLSGQKSQNALVDFLSLSLFWRPFYWFDLEDQDCSFSPDASIRIEMSVET